LLLLLLLLWRLPVLNLSFWSYLDLRSFYRFLNSARPVGPSEEPALGLLLHLLGQLTVRVGEVEKRLYDVGAEHLILLPQVEDTDHFALKK
jgi:hypothetical protein